MKVGEAERPFVVAEALAVAENLPPGETRQTFQEIAWSADRGEVPGDLELDVGELIGLAVETGRARASHGPAGVRALLAVWKETPQGREAVRAAQELNEALAALRGEAVQSIRVSATGPGSHTVTLAAGDYQLRLTLDRSGASLRSVTVGGGEAGE